ncbi:Stk1 family PASTA domain-containing Ser/Thr kinase [Streptacidiphilus sp. ASG 303]|uniref:Stk1 family PASTA domain-containing Ser/Thr kinase n=1 Tax=Streptacidiphilus sp. ASG 303 TaxID=2896847 RepID=UPI001E5C9CAF|nr:Stk1 family PASTA domain-containing Ser/Thr kinase [Streptacidiphilus sp. ASG 303]MCD0481660.1 Stk1 family PASTA domain-containing Ser/Thr kinase [Streptacidiphilus sp. ASG 303]
MDTTLHDPLIGALLDGRYRVEQRLAVGGMATVYRGTDTRLDRVVALKVMHPALAADAAFTSRFIREAKAVARLSHPNVVNVFDQGADGSCVFLAMEYVPGCTLRDVLRDRGALSVRAALDILEPVLAALGAAHRAGLVHRDVKPENVLITDAGLVKVADFGLVRTVAADAGGPAGATPAGTVIGSVSYLSPEQIRQQPADPRSDVYACGIVLYEMLTGRKPHSGDSPTQIVYRHLGEDVPPPSLAVPGLPRELDAVVAAATARDPGRRPYDAVELLAVLQRLRRDLDPALLDAEPPASTRPTPQYPANEATAMLPALPPDGGPPFGGPLPGGRAPGGPVPGSSAAPEHTSVLELPSDLVMPQSRAYDETAEFAGLPAPARRSRRGPVTVAVLTALVVVVGLATWLLSGALYATTPSVLGMDRQAAAARLQSAGLSASFTEAFSETVPRGQVVESDPGPGARARKDHPVTVVLSRGPERIAVPTVAGRAVDEARRRLTDAGLSPGTVSEDFSDSIPQGSVIRTDPAAGRELARETPVSLVVSKGPAPLPVPQVVGVPVDEAQAQLTDEGFTVRISPDQVFSDTVEAGSVASQDPDDRAGPGATVTLTVSKGPQVFPVPDVRGRSEADATATLRAAGFQVRALRLNPFGTPVVRNQNPGGGDQQPKGATITIVLL